MGVFGDTFRQARTEKGVSLRDVEQATRINRHHLQAIEDEQFALLPPLIYQRGIVRNYATYLGIEPGKALALFEEARGADAPFAVVPSVKPTGVPTHWSPNFAIIAFMVVMSAIVFAWIYSISFNDTPTVTSLPEVVPTVTPSADQSLSVPTPTVAVVQPLPAVEPQPGQVTTIAQPVQPLATQPAVSALPTVGIATVVPATGVNAQATAAAAPPTATPVGGLAQPTAAAAQQDQSTQAVPQGQGATTIRVTATGGIALYVVGDGNVLFDGWLEPGTTTQWFNANAFEVTTSDGSLTQFENAANGNVFFMGYGPNETYYLAN